MSNQYLDNALDNNKFQLVSEPHTPEDNSFGNRATFIPYVDDQGAGFKSFLRHPSEKNKTIKTKAGQDIPMSSVPIQARMDPVRFRVFTNAIRKLINDPEYKGRMIKCFGVWYDNDGNPYTPEGQKSSISHVATLFCGRNEHGEIIVGVKEMKHPLRDYERVGVKFAFNEGMWFDMCDPDTSDKTDRAVASKENAEAFIDCWNDLMVLGLTKNWEDRRSQREERKLKARERRNGNRPQNGGGNKPTGGSDPWA